MAGMSTHDAGRRSILRSLSGLDQTAFGDERERRIWMESYVLAYEVALLATVALAAAMSWVGDRNLALWSIGVLWIVALGNVAALGHLRAHGMTDLPWRARWSFWSFRLRILLGAVWLIGLAGTLGGGFEPKGWSEIAGIVCGVAFAVVGFVLADRRTKRRAEQDLPADDTFEAR